MKAVRAVTPSRIQERGVRVCTGIGSIRNRGIFISRAQKAGNIFFLPSPRYPKRDARPGVNGIYKRFEIIFMGEKLYEEACLVGSAKCMCGHGTVDHGMVRYGRSWDGTVR